MIEGQTALFGIFDDSAKADRATEQLRQLGLAEKQIERAEKATGKRQPHGVPRRADTVERSRPDFASHGISTEAASYYGDAYDAGYTVLVVHPGNKHTEAARILKHNGAYNYEAPRPAKAEATGATTPGMRGEDNTQTGIASTAAGSPAAHIDADTIEADVQHAQRILQQQYEARKEQGRE
ncbi:hypothetical protein EPA93_07440 [Ktedonosporobacter rubrisoli]|uniref:General stress protein 17M-like domain-containing protein n=1 Tax=Ktedonosporobacter rubrisoli TaxID=2509675 RepID=A0A4P6JKY5_KTERU|nr:hypothetical protein [Ktedonosporobacter rubrisoli]QBD75848.1 hypothetical protein EPA93_07440 [Ktedonosporobacter rubrisoli]